MKKIFIIVLLPVAILVAIISVCVIQTENTYRHADSINTQRIRAMMNDGFFNCRMAGISPATLGNYKELGTTHGVFYGGRSSNIVVRSFYCNVDLDSAIVAFGRCAQANGWLAHHWFHYKAHSPGLQGTKQYPDGWKAEMEIKLGLKTYDTPPVFEVWLKADAF